MSNIIKDDFYKSIAATCNETNRSYQDLILVIKDTNKTEHYGLFSNFVNDNTEIELQYQSNKYFTSEFTIPIKNIRSIEYFMREIY